MGVVPPHSDGVSRIPSPTLLRGASLPWPKEEANRPQRGHHNWIVEKVARLHSPYQVWRWMFHPKIMTKAEKWTENKSLPSYTLLVPLETKSLKIELLGISPPPWNIIEMSGFALQSQGLNLQQGRFDRWPWSWELTPEHLECPARSSVFVYKRAMDHAEEATPTVRFRLGGLGHLVWFLSPRKLKTSGKKQEQPTLRPLPS